MQVVRVIRVGERNTRVLLVTGSSVLVPTDQLREHFRSLQVVREGSNNVRLRYPDGSSVLVPTGLYNNTVVRRSTSTSSDWNPIKFGIEFEFLCPTSNVDRLVRTLGDTVEFRDNRNHYGSTTTRLWELTYDGSVHGGTGYRGYELVSPPLTAETFADVKRVLQVMDDYGCFVMKCCGTHVHFSWSHDTTETERKFMFDEYGKWEFFFDRLVSRSRRGNNNHYCKSCNDHNYSDRYHKFNIAAYAKHGTCEIRQHQGTLSFKKISSWVKMMSKWFQVIHSADYVVPSSVDQAIEVLELNRDEVLSRMVQLES